MQEWLNWPAWKASKRQKRFRGSNPLLSAIRVEQTTNKSSVLFCINGLCASPHHFSKTKQPAAIALLRLFSVGHSHSIGVSSVVYFRTAFRDCGTSFADDTLIVRHSNPLLSALRVEQTTLKSSVLFCIYVYVYVYVYVQAHTIAPNQNSLRLQLYS